MAFAPRCTRKKAKGPLESLLLFNILRLRSIPLLILPLHVGLDLLPIRIGFCTSNVNGRGLPALQDVNVCPKVVHTSTNYVAFSLWRRPRLRRGSGMLGLSRFFLNCCGRSFRALRGMPLRATPLHSASDKGSGRLDGVWGPRELEVIHVHFVRNWCYLTEAVHGVLLVEANNVRPQHLPQTQKSFPMSISKLSSSSFQVRYRRLDNTLYWNHCETGRQ